MNFYKKIFFSFFKKNFNTFNKDKDKDIFRNLIINNSIINMYRGVEIDLGKILTKNNLNNIPDANDIGYVIDSVMTEFNKNKMRSVTIKIPINLSHTIPHFVNRNFYFHHTTEDSLSVCKWLDNTTPNKIPKFAHHHIGVGACIFNNNMDFLLIREKYSTMNKNNIPLWKFVTGLVEEGETIKEATVREIKEEVDMEVEFHGCILITERYPSKYMLSDICFFNLCTIKGSPDFKNISIDKDELTEAQFFNFEKIKNIINENDATIPTIKTLNKVISLLNFEKNFEENLKQLESNECLFNLKEGSYSKSKHLNFFH
jgi:ADP-ribose pyrophosphatase YjhB (NUDIX family)